MVGLEAEWRRAGPAIRAARYPTSPPMTLLASITDPDRRGGRGRRGCDGPAGSVRADGAGERLHPRAERGHHAVRRLQRVATASTACSPPSRSARSPTWSAPGSPTGSATPAAWTSSRSTARSCTSRRATSSGPTAGSSATATPPSSSRACCRSSARSSRCPPGVARMPFWRFSVLTLPGCIPWVLMLTFIGKQAGDNWEDWKDTLHYVDYAVAAAIVIGVVYLLIRARRRRKARRRRPGDRIGLSAPAASGAAARRCSRARPSCCRCRARATWRWSRACSAGATRSCRADAARRSRSPCTPARRRRCAIALRGELGRDPHLQALTLLPPAAAGLLFERPIERRLGRGALGGGGRRSLAGAALLAADRPAGAARRSPTRSTTWRSGSPRPPRWCPACRAPAPR